MALEAGHTREARKLFIQARRLDPSQPSAREMLKDPTSGIRHLLIAAFVILMVIGVGGFLLNWLSRHQSTRDFCLLSEEEPLTLSGPGGRTFFIAGHAMLVRRRLTHWMIPWAELREVFKVPGDDRSTGGLLFWRRSGEAYFVSEDTCDDFGSLIEAVERFVVEAEVPFTAAHSDEQSEAAANFLIVRRLNVTDSRRILIQRIGFALGIAASVSLCTGDLNSGMSGLFLYAVAAGIGLGFTLVVMAISNALLPFTRA